jgi:hypothetical protein
MKAMVAPPGVSFLGSGPQPLRLGPPAAVCAPSPAAKDFFFFCKIKAFWPSDHCIKSNYDRVCLLPLISLVNTHTHTLVCSADCCLFFTHTPHQLRAKLSFSQSERWPFHFFFFFFFKVTYLSCKDLFMMVFGCTSARL